MAGEDVSALVPETDVRPATLEFVVVALAALGGEGTVMAVAVGQIPAPVDMLGGVGAALALHLLLVGALAGWVVSRVRRRADVRLPGLLLVTAGFLGPLGVGASLFSAALFAVFSRYAMGFEEWYLSLFPENEVEPAQELFELILTGREQSGVAAGDSFTDIMTMGTPSQKQAVIALVARHFRPAFTPALKLALADADPSVRVQAATATARVEHEFNERWQKLERARQSTPDDAPSCVALARHLDQYAFCGLLDTGRELEVREKALEGYRVAARLAPGDDEIRFDLGRLLLRMGMAGEAAAALEPLVPRTEDQRALIWYAESLFRLGRFSDLRALCRRRDDLIGPTASLADALADVLGLWNGANEVEAAQIGVEEVGLGEVGA